MQIIALYSIKGGVGKTAACVNLAYLAARGSGPTLLCDLDPQGSSSFYFRIRPKARFSGKQFLQGGRRLDRAIRGTDFPDLDLLPAHLSFRNLDIHLSKSPDSRDQLSSLLREFSGSYNQIFLDCPPNITLVSENVFRAADLILVPLIPTTLSMMTFDKLLRFFKEAKLDRHMIHPFMSMVEARKRMHRNTIKEIIKAKIKPLDTFIPYCADIERMGLFRAPLVHSQPRSIGSYAFTRLWEEIKDLQGEVRK